MGQLLNLAGSVTLISGVVRTLTLKCTTTYIRMERRAWQDRAFTSNCNPLVLLVYSMGNKRRDYQALKRDCFRDSSRMPHIMPDPRPTSGQPQADFGPTPGQLRADPRPTSGRLEANFGPTLGQLWADFGTTLGQLRVDFWPTSEFSRFHNFSLLVLSVP